MHMKLRKKNKKKKYFFLFLMVIYFSSFFLTIKLHFSNKDHSKFIRYLLENNSNYIKKKEDKRIVTKVVSYIANVDFKNPITLINNNYKISASNKSSSDEDKDISDLPVNNHIEDPYPEKEIDKPIVYLYNTHQREEYALSNNEAYNIKPTVMTLSYILREKLNRNNIPTIVEENDVLDVLRINNWNYAASYKVTRMMLASAKENNSTLKYFIDLHRDSISKKASTITINDINYAKILFIVGLENPNYEVNLALTEKINNMINNKYPNLSRGIYKKQGKGVNGVYNQDFDKNTILIEVGGEENTIDEVYNTAEVISEILTEYIRNDQNG